MKVPLSYSDGGGGGLLTRAFGTVALAAVLAVSTGTASAGAERAGAPPPEQPRPTVKVVVIGDSFTSGEGANPATYRTVGVPQTTEEGITYQSYQADPAHQSSTAPTLQAINQIQGANPGVDIQVSFVPVSGATRDSLYQTTRPGTPFEQPPQIDAVNGADVVIVGIGGNDARFSEWVRGVLFSTDSTSAQQFPQYMQQFNDGTYLANQVTLLNDVAQRAAPNATIISLGYPKAMPDTIPGTPTWWSPYSWSSISQGEANLSNQLATTLSSNNQDASLTAASQNPGRQFLFGDVATALQGHELFTNREGLNGLTPSNTQGSYHPNDLGQQLLGSVMQPYVEQAVNSQLARVGVQGAENVAPITPTFSYLWNLRVDVPLQVQAQQAHEPPADQPQRPAEQPQQPPTEQPQQPPAEQPQQPPARDTDQSDSTDRARPAQPGAAQPEAAQPDAAQPDGAQPGGAQPNAVQPEAVQPDAAQPEAVQPDAAQPGGAQPNAVQPEAIPPDAAQPAQAPVDASGAPTDTPAPADAPAPAEAPAVPAPAEAPAVPEPVVEAPAVPAPVETPAVPEPVAVPVIPEPVVAPPAPVVVPEPAPIIDIAPAPIAPLPPPVITVPEPPAITPINPVDTGLSGSSDTGLGGLDTGLGSDTGFGDTGLGSGGFDTGGFTSVSDSGGGGEG